MCPCIYLVQHSSLLLYRCAEINRESQWNDPQVVLVGNKLDMKRVITREKAEGLAESLGVKYFETSARKDANIDEAFEVLVDLISIEKDQPTHVQPTQTQSRDMNRSSKCGC